MNNKKLLVVLGIVVAILGVIVGVFIAGQKKDPEAQAKKKDSAQPKTGVKLDVGKAKKYDAPEHSKDHPIAVITFTDGGVPYNPLERPDPDVTLSAGERPIGGLGIYIVKNSMDSLSYEYKDGKNILKMQKRLVEKGE